MKGRRVSGTLLFCGVSGTLLSVAFGRSRIDREVARATITPAHHRISQMRLQRSVEVSSKPGSLSGTSNRGAAARD
jgi:hypothetical protein